MRTIKFISRDEATILGRYAKTRTWRGYPKVYEGIFGGIFGTSAAILSRLERPRRDLKQYWGDFRLILKSWSQLVVGGFLRRGARPTFSSDTAPSQQRAREDNAVLQTQQKGGDVLNHRRILGACGAICLLFLSSCAHCPMCGHCGAGASGGKSQVNKERTAQARRSASETGSAQHFETPMHRSPR